MNNIAYIDHYCIGRKLVSGISREFPDFVTSNEQGTVLAINDVQFR